MVGRRTANRLAATSEPLKKDGNPEPGDYADGNGLWLQVRAPQPKNEKQKTAEETNLGARQNQKKDAGSSRKTAEPERWVTRSWILRYTFNSKQREMGLGSYPKVSLKTARTLAGNAHDLLAEGIDPIEDRRKKKQAETLANAKAIAFSECAKKYIEATKSTWKNAKHAAQWKSTLETYAYPFFGSLPVQVIDTGLVFKALDPIWYTKPETASRVRGRIEKILDWAKTRGYREGENPARWRGHLEHTYPEASKLKNVQHHPALPYAEMYEFMQQLKASDYVSSHALQFCILTAARTGEVIGAKWEEFDFKEKVWTIPAERMKAKREHRVPLTDAAISILRKREKIASGVYVFENNPDKPLSNMGMANLLAGIRTDITVHGFRSSFRDWAAEQTSFAREVAEGALAHVNQDKVEAAYQRGDLMQKRRLLMQTWAKYCITPLAKKVINFRGRKSR